MELNEKRSGGNRLEELGGSDYEIVDGEHDIKGWDVKNEFGQKVGAVDELLFDPESRIVRYLVVDLDDNELELENHDRRVLIPIGLAALHSSDDEEEADETGEGETHIRDFSAAETTFAEDEPVDLEDHPTPYDPYDDGDVVIIPNITVSQLNALPAYETDQVSPEVEAEIRNILEGSGSTETFAEENFYNHDHFNENRFYDPGNTGATEGGDRLVQRPITKGGQALQESENELNQRNDIPFNEDASANNSNLNE